MSRARDVASLLNTVATDTELNNAISAVPTSSKNLLYNGAMQVAQRGTSVTGHTGGGSGYLTADRWSLAIGNQGTWNVSIENDAPVGSGFAKSYKVLCTTPDATTNADDLIILQQMLEGQDLQRIKKGTSDAQALTFSFWVKTNVSGTQIVNLIDADNVRQVSASVALDGTGTWQKKVVTFPADTTGAFDNDNNLSLRVRWWLAAGSSYTTGTLPTTWGGIDGNSAVGQTNFAAATNNYWQVTGVQLEVGDTATEFEHLPYGVELAKCQRYYYRTTVEYPDALGFGQAFSSNSATVLVNYPQTMRATPTLEQSGTPSDYSVWNSTGASLSCTAVPNAHTSTGVDKGFVQFTVSSGLTAGNAALAIAWNTNGYLGFNAEL